MTGVRRRSLLLRLLGLSLAVAILAIAATAWLASRQTSDRLRAGFASTLEADSYVHQQLIAYAQAHDSWAQVRPLLQRLAEQTGRRIGLTTPGGRLIADSAGQSSDGLSENPVAEIDVNTGELAITSSLANWRLTEKEAQLKGELLKVAETCIQQKDPDAGLAVGPDGSLAPTELQAFNAAGVPVAGAGGAGAPVASATPLPEPSTTVTEAAPLESGMVVEYEACVPAELRKPSAAAAKLGKLLGKLTEQCLARHGLPPKTQLFPPGVTAVYTDDGTVTMKSDQKTQKANKCVTTAAKKAMAPFVPPPALLYTGSADRFDPFSGGGWKPTTAAGLSVLVVAAGLTLLAGRRLTKPIRALTVAANQMGEGDRHARVPVSGQDEVAQLGQAFNAMADSIATGERQRKTMVADIAHELRAPLANVRGYLEAAEDGVVPLDGELVSSLREEADQLHHLIDDLGILALADAGELRMHPEDVDAADLAARVVAAHQAAAAQADVALTLDSDGPVAVYADPMRLRQALGNLVGNAVRYTPGGGTVRVGVAVEEPDDGVRIVVSDDGPGIAAEHLPRVFDRFYRAEKSRSRTTGGSGLGLAITRQLVEAGGGTVSATSTEGDGATFTIRLPGGRTD